MYMQVSPCSGGMRMGLPCMHACRSVDRLCMQVRSVCARMQLQLAAKHIRTMPHCAQCDRMRSARRMHCMVLVPASWLGMHMDMPARGMQPRSCMPARMTE